MMTFEEICNEEVQGFPAFSGADCYYYGAEYSDLLRLYHQIRRKHGVTLARVR